MLLSIVTGTHNRLPELAAMMRSARRDVAYRLDYEFVIVDGGSEDGTLEWLRAQADVRLIEQGQLVGAIKAFGAGARAAAGRFVLLANDDVRFARGSVLAALRHLDSSPGCGAVAFADNRSAQMTGGSRADYRVESIGAIKADGTQTMVPYAQVGLFRKEAAEAAGWWGDEDPIMSKARTYGGDSYLSARLWEMGWTVDAVAGAQVDDLIIDDRLRRFNAQHGPGDSDLYYTRYRQGPRLPTVRQSADTGAALRILYAPVYEPNFPMEANREYGMGDALAHYGMVIEHDFLNDRTPIVEVAKAWQPELVLLQIQGTGPKLTTDHLRQMRADCPNAVIVNWCGDAANDKNVSPGVLELLRLVDLQTVVNAAHLPVYRSEGIPAAFWQIGYKDGAAPVGVVPAWDVVYQGNHYEYRNAWFAQLARMRQRGLQLGVYGNWSRADGNTHYNFAAQAAINASAKIVLGDTFPGGVGFVSNRMLQVLSAGGFMLHQRVPELERWTGLVENVHYAVFETVDQLPEMIAYWLTEERAEARARIAAAGRQYVRAQFSQDAQAGRLFTQIIPEALSDPA